MDVIFGSISAEERKANIEKQERGEVWLTSWL